MTWTREWPWGSCDDEKADRIEVCVYEMDAAEVVALSWQTLCWMCGFRLARLSWSEALAEANSHALFHKARAE